MFSNIKKIDPNGNIIKNFKVWRKSNPLSLFFDSKVEWLVWKYLTINGIPIEVEPKIDLQPSIKVSELKKGVVKTTTQLPISFKPDFLLKNDDVYIEVKGWATPEFRLRWKLFKLKGYEGYIVQSIKELKEILIYLKYDVSKHKVPSG
jgi:hypothetical protein